MNLSVVGPSPNLEGWDTTRPEIARVLLYACIGVLVYLGPPAIY